ncbi:hypothetical protein FIBSPDRAFT_930994 [Athelia psychrophila]|uniref:Uncharacterized protein n=1 Tax=Athelia psychrophila TaxID=1759441 RepID=A0A166L3Y8_9AGAM|nr:hypothetical protein FIBSPDRAFT_930994 [Fibularhizoctonia sp. CBS 109695]
MKGLWLPRIHRKVAGGVVESGGKWEADAARMKLILALLAIRTASVGDTRNLDFSDHITRLSYLVSVNAKGVQLPNHNADRMSAGPAYEANTGNRPDFALEIVRLHQPEAPLRRGSVESWGRANFEVGSPGDPEDNPGTEPSGSPPHRPASANAPSYHHLAFTFVAVLGPCHPQVCLPDRLRLDPNITKFHRLQLPTFLRTVSVYLPVYGNKFSMSLRKSRKSLNATSRIHVLVTAPKAPALSGSVSLPPAVDVSCNPPHPPIASL